MIRTPFLDGWTVVRDGSDGRPHAVTLPHDAMLAERRDPATANGHHSGFYPGGVYRYAKRFTPPAEWCSRTVQLELEGVYLRSEVRLNGVLIGGRPSGYAAFRVDLGDALRLGEENLLEIVANNPSGPNSRWYTGSGVYRPVHLLIADRLHLAPDGVHWRTLDVQQGIASVEVHATVLNDDETARSADLVVDLCGVRATGRPVSVPAGGSAELVIELAVRDAELWSVDRPRLHDAVATLTEGGATVDVQEDRIGLRIVAADARHGLRINGETVKLRGACIHHDNGVIGAHTLDAAEERRVRILKESGYNAIRSAHNPISRALLRACDRLGMLVMDELTDEWWRPKARDGYSRDFSTWWRADLESMVRKDLNHPSVIMHSIGNEIAEVATPRGERLGHEMVAFAKGIDPTRLVTNGVNYFLSFIAPLEEPDAGAKKGGKERDPEKLIATLNLLMGVLEKVTPLLMRLPRADTRTREAQAALDVAGYNYAHDRWIRDTAAYPDRVILGTETSPNTTAKLWRMIETMPNVIGEFVWTGWDYIGEAGIATQQYDRKRTLFQPWPALLAGEPLIDITGFRQPWSYYTEILWRLRSAPYLAVRPLDRVRSTRTKNNWRPTDAVHSWSWAGYEGVQTTVEVYTRAKRVELFLDDRLVGSAVLSEEDECRAEIPVTYRPGTLTAVAYAADGSVVGRDTLVSAMAETQLRLTAEPGPFVADGADLLFVEVELTDDVGVRKPLADRPVTVEVSGEGTLLGFGSADPTTTEQVSAPTRSTYQGRALAVVRATRTAGTVRVRATAAGVRPVVVEVASRPASAGLVAVNT